MGQVLKKFFYNKENIDNNFYNDDVSKIKTYNNTYKLPYPNINEEVNLDISQYKMFTPNTLFDDDERIINTSQSNTLCKDDTNIIANILINNKSSCILKDGVNYIYGIETYNNDILLNITNFNNYEVNCNIMVETFLDDSFIISPTKTKSIDLTEIIREIMIINSFLLKIFLTFTKINCDVDKKFSMSYALKIK